MWKVFENVNCKNSYLDAIYLQLGHMSSTQVYQSQSASAYRYSINYTQHILYLLEFVLSNNENPHSPLQPHTRSCLNVETEQLVVFPRELLLSDHFK